MTLVRIIALKKFFNKKEINIVIMGGSAKGEERIYRQTNYFEELTNFFPGVTFKLHFAGPELSPDSHLKEESKNDRLHAKFYRGTTSEYLLNGFKHLCAMEAELPKENTIFIGFNPGFGSGYEKLLVSWALDILFLVNL